MADTPNQTFRRLLIAGGLTFLLAGAAAVPASAADAQVKLFKVVTPKDDVVVGITPADLAHFGAGADVEVLSKQVAAAGQLTLWQYVTRKSASGELELAAAKKISIFAAGVVRIEPYAASIKVVPPTE